MMARGEKRGNREAKKPKKEKPKQLVQVSPFGSQNKSSVSEKTPGGKR
jgi:hypothetical protein